jgi:hypothetical protein
MEIAKHFLKKVIVESRQAKKQFLNEKGSSKNWLKNDTHHHG